MVLHRSVHNTEQIILRLILKINIKTLKILKMPKIKSTVGSRLRSFVSEFGANIFFTDGMVLFCKVCNVAVASEKKFTIQQHISRDKHARGIQRKLNEVKQNN
ncbi:PC4 and SFRS1-interacting protein isoform X1, partial [Aphis craccivora]